MNSTGTILLPRAQTACLLHLPMQRVPALMVPACLTPQVKNMRFRENCASFDFSDILEEEMELALKQAAQISMGTEISEGDMDNIAALCEQVIDLADYRGQLFDYLKNRMTAIAPNLTAMVGELVGARLIAHAGSLMNLAKHPGSTIQILGAEKALFRALKTKSQTPKYGLIFHASLIGQSAPKIKGKVSRLLASKSALAVRYDALGEAPDATFGNMARQQVRLVDNIGCLSHLTCRL